MFHWKQGVMEQRIVLMGPMSTFVVSDFTTFFDREINPYFIECEAGFTNCPSSRRLSHSCIPNSWVCDGGRDCESSIFDDEANCSKFE